MSSTTKEKPSAPTPAAAETIAFSTSPEGHFRYTSDDDLAPGILINPDAPIGSLVAAAITRTSLVARSLLGLSTVSLNEVDTEALMLLLAMTTEQADMLLERAQQLDYLQRHEGGA